MQLHESTIARLKKLPVLFRIDDVRKFTPHAAVFLSRAQKKGYIKGLTRGHYVNSFLYGEPSVEQIGCFLRPPAYISCEWALNYHGITLQAPVVCTVITLHTAVGHNRRFQYRDVTYEFSRIKPSLFFGFEYQQGFYMAKPEKAILDTLYFRESVPVEDELEMTEVDMKELTGQANKYPGSVQKKLALLLNITVESR